MSDDDAGDPIREAGARIRAMEAALVAGKRSAAEALAARRVAVAQWLEQSHALYTAGTEAIAAARDGDVEMARRRWAARQALVAREADAADAFNELQARVDAMTAELRELNARIETEKRSLPRLVSVYPFDEARRPSEPRVGPPTPRPAQLDEAMATTLRRENAELAAFVEERGGDWSAIAATLRGAPRE